MFSSRDLTTSYWNVRLDERVQEMTTSRWKYESFYFLLFPFGVKTGPLCFHLAATILFDDLQFVIGYIDEAIVKSNRRRNTSIICASCLVACEESVWNLNWRSVSLGCRGLACCAIWWAGVGFWRILRKQVLFSRTPSREQIDNCDHFLEWYHNIVLLCKSLPTLQPLYMKHQHQGEVWMEWRGAVGVWEIEGTNG